MKTKHIRIAQGIIAGLFVIAILYFIAGIAIDKKTGPLKAQERFDQFMLQTSTIAAKYEPLTPEFNGEFTRSLKDIDDYHALTLTLNGTLIYTYPPDAVTATSDLVTADFSGTAKTVLGNTLSVSASLYALKPFSIYHYAKVSFLLILLGTLAAIALLLYIQFANREPRRHKPFVFTFDDSADAYTDARSEDAEADFSEEDEPYSDDDDAFDPIGAMEEENKLSADETAIPAAFFEDEPEPLPSETNTLSPLYAEDELESHLAQTLTEAAANGTDVSLLIFSLEHLSDADSVTERIALLLQHKIGNLGAVYRGNDGFCVIMKNTPLDTALATAQSLYGSIDEHLAASGIATTNAIGISARTQRTVTAQRLITEAKQAVVHASQDPDSPIIAFRVNPEKYREYMAQR